MKTYLRLYRWSMQMKLHMALYTFAAVFFKIICNLLQGSRQVSIVDLATIWLVSLVFAILETVLFPENAPCTKGRSLLWLAAANLCFVGGFAVRLVSGCAGLGRRAADPRSGTGAGHDVVWRPVRPQNGHRPAERTAPALSAAQFQIVLPHWVKTTAARHLLRRVIVMSKRRPGKVFTSLCTKRKAGNHL